MYLNVFLLALEKLPGSVVASFTLEAVVFLSAAWLNAVRLSWRGSCWVATLNTNCGKQT